MVQRLVIAPHADDEVMGCGGLLAKYPETAVAVLASPDDGRMEEMHKARRALGLTGMVHFADFPDGDIGEHPKKVVAWLDTLLSLLQPDEVYLPYPGSHQDHVATYEASIRACRQSLDPGHWMPPTVLVYETPAYDIDLLSYPLRYSLFESLDEDQVMAKCKAMEAYESACEKPHPGSPEHLADRARALGIARDVAYAEQFAVVRMVRP